MESALKTLGVAFAAAAFAALAAGPGLAQEAASPAEAPKVGTEAAPAGAAAVTRSGSDTRSRAGGASGDRGADPSSTRTGNLRTGPGSDAGRKPNGRGTGPGAMLPPPAVTADHIDLAVPSGLQRRTNLKTLIANAPRKPVGVLVTSTPQMPRPGADGGTRNAVGVMVPGATGGPHVGATPAHPGPVTGGVAATNPIGAGTTGMKGPADIHRPAVPLSSVAAPAAHTAVINGSSVNHVGSGPSTIGGPTKNVFGINGTAMRPKH
jgi:hypothetical protein